MTLSTSRMIALAAACLAAMTAGPAFAQDGERLSPLPSHLPLNTEMCFGRVYDSAHLAKHPKQRVTHLHLFRGFAPDLTTETEPLSAEELREQDGQSGYVNLTAYVRFRDKKGLFSHGLSCRKDDEGRVRCGIDCDGGGFKLRARGPSLLLENEGFVVVGGCGASEDESERAEFVSPGEDDKLFRLDRKPVAECVALRDADRPAWAKLGPPLRERFAASPTACFSRVYDDAHLRAHPGQTVRRIAVLKTQAAQGNEATAPSYRLTFRIELKNGVRAEKATVCNPESYAYACTHDEPIDMARDFYLTRAGNEHIMLRDKRSMLAKMFDVALGSDDRMFRLQAAPDAACAF